MAHSRALCGAVLALGVGAQACSPAPVGESVERAGQAVIGGSASGPQRDAVVFVRQQNSPTSAWLDCSGTLLSPRVLVTARHCVAAVQGSHFVCTPEGDLRDDGSGSGLFGALVDPASLHVYVGALPGEVPAAAGARILATDATSACRDDVAFVVLDRGVAAPSYPAVRWRTPTPVGEKVIVIGFGLGDRTDRIERREVGGVRILDVGPLTPDPSATTPPRTFVVGGDTLCVGDSGGPAIAEDTGALIGVYSRVTGDCFAVSSRNTFAAMASYASLLEQAFAATGETPQRENDVVAASDGGAPEPAQGGETSPAASTGANPPSPATGCALSRVPGSRPSAALGALGLFLAAAGARRARERRRA